MKCQRCEAEFEPPTYNAMYCSPCRPIAKREKDYAKRTADRAAARVERGCKDCGGPLPPSSRMYCEACYKARRRESSRRSSGKQRERALGIKFYVRSTMLANLAVAMIESCKGEDCDDCVVSFFCPGGGNGSKDSVWGNELGEVI